MKAHTVKLCSPIASVSNGVPGTPLAKARSNRPHVPELGCSISSSAVVFSLALSCPSLAQSAESSANHAVVLLENQGVQPAASAFPRSSIVTRPVSSGSPSKTEAAATKKAATAQASSKKSKK